MGNVFSSQDHRRGGADEDRGRAEAPSPARPDAPQGARGAEPAAPLPRPQKQAKLDHFLVYEPRRAPVEGPAGSLPPVAARVGKEEDVAVAEPVRLPPELLHIIFEFALPRCLKSLVPVCRAECKCHKCDCSTKCAAARKLAIKLSKVNRFFRRAVAPRIYQCVSLAPPPPTPYTYTPTPTGASAKIDRLHRTLDHFGAARLVRSISFELRPADRQLGLPKAVEIVRAATHLRSLAVSSFFYAHIPGDGILEAARRCKHLRSLSLEGVSFSQVALSQTIEAAEELKSLRFAGLVPSGLFTALADSAPSGLLALSLGPWRSADDEMEADVVAFLEDDLFSLITWRIKSLARLQIRNAALLSNQAVGAALERFSDLKFLDLSFCQGVSNAALSRFTGTGLKVLRLDGVHQVTDAGLVPLLDRNPGLVEIDLCQTAIGAATLKKIGEKCHSLVDLNLSRTSLSSAALIEYLKAPPARLKVLRLALIGGVNDAVVRLIAKKLPKITKLSLLGCNGLRDPAENLLLLAYARRKTLVQIDIDGVNVIDDDLAFALERILERS
ncbi:hypothetical protein DFJ74DRAFT_768722 [Hyaloraphidium curvatum]|nr:hypothetical protein DFJ74DRAFT_768722 [Hyaloraphidium curvatum]